MGNRYSPVDRRSRKDWEAAVDGLALKVRRIDRSKEPKQSCAHERGLARRSRGHSRAEMTLVRIADR
jgi:hypothetical protein